MQHVLPHRTDAPGGAAGRNPLDRTLLWDIMKPCFLPNVSTHAALRRTAPPKTSSSDSKSTRPQRSRLALSLARRKPDPFRTILKSLAHAHSGERKASLDAPPRAAISAQSGPCGRLAKTARGISGRIAQTCCCLECSGCAQLHFGSPFLSGNGKCVFEHVEGDLLASQRKSVESGVPPQYADTN